VRYAGLDYGTGPRATPTVEGNRVYAVGAVGTFVCLEAPSEPGAKPRVVWRHNLIEEFDGRVPKWGVACSPLVEGDLVIVQPGGKGGSVVAFDKNSGELRWRAGKNPAGYSSPVGATVGGQRVVFAMTGDALLVIRTADGAVTDSYDWGTQHNANIATPVVVEDYVFISSAYMQGCALLRAELRGDEVKLVPVYARRRPPGLQNHHASSVFKKVAAHGTEKRYLFGFDGETVTPLKCVAFDTGEVIWDAGREVGKGTITLVGDHLVIQTQEGNLCLVEATPEEFRLVAKLPKVLSGNYNWATPTLVDGRLYLRDEQKVVCYDVRP
jgi:outer membrane protein assembly factor BamB